MTLRILYVAHNRCDPGKGAAFADLSLLAALRRRGHEVEECWDFAAGRRITHPNLHYLLEAPRQCEILVRRKIREASRDVVIANQPLGYRAAGAVRAVAPRTLFIGRSHGWEPRVFEAMGKGLSVADPRPAWRVAAARLLKGPLFRQNGLLSARAHGLVVCSVDDRDWIVERHRVAPERVLALEPGLPAEMLEEPRADYGPERLRRVLYVGQFAAVKGPEVVGRVFGEVLERVPEAEATWVCAREDHAAAQRLIPERVRSRVTMLGWMTRRNLVEVYDRHALFVFPSYFEGFAQTFLEATARGLVVLASRIDGMRQTLRDGVNGYLFEPGEAHEIASRTIALLGDPATIRRVGTAARETARGFTWDRSASVMESFLGSLGAGAGK